MLNCTICCPSFDCRVQLEFSLISLQKREFLSFVGKILQVTHICFGWITWIVCKRGEKMIFQDLTPNFLISVMQKNAKKA
jgi:hypothetical protein